MYVHSIVVKMCWVVGCHIGIKCKYVYVGFGIVLYAAVMLPRFYRCQDFLKS